MKLLKYFVIFFAIFFLSEAKSSPDALSYEAGVVEYYPTFLPNNEHDVETNLNRILELINDPNAANLDILVFGEYTLMSVPDAIYIPEPEDKIIPCDNDTYNTTDILKQLSCAAKNTKKYLMVNLIEKANCPDKEMLANNDKRECREMDISYYNDNIVFDRNGTLITKYRKFNLFQEDVDHPKFPQIATFETDFGVTFGTFICFDINFAEPSIDLIRKHNITDIVYSAYWNSELPHATAVQMQQNVAYLHNINLLAAGGSVPQFGQTGSGIYAGRLGPLISVINGSPETRLLTATVPKRTSNITDVVDNSIRRTPREMEGLYILREDMDGYKTVEIPLNESKFEQDICYKNILCCKFEVVSIFENSSIGEDFYQYRAVVFSGNRSFVGEADGNISLCYIVACTNNSIKSCAFRFEDTSKVKDLTTFVSITISGTFKYGDKDFLFPSGVDTSIMPLNPKEFTYEEEQVALKKKFIRVKLVKQRSNLLSFGINGRVFEDNSSGSLKVNLILLLIFSYLVSRYF